MIIVSEFATFILLSLGIAKLSALGQNSILVFLFGCALSYAWLWWPKNKFRLVTGSDHIQLYRLIIGLALGYWGAHLWIGTDPIWFRGAWFESMAFFFFVSAFPQDHPVSALMTKSVKGSKVKTKMKVASVKKKSSSKPAGISDFSTKLLILLVVLGVAMEFSFFKDSLIWAFAFMAAVIGVTVWLKLIRKNPPEESTGLNENYILAGLLILAAAMRFPFLWSNLTAFQIDEANDMQGAQDFLRNAVRSPFCTGWSGRATFPFAVFADFFKVFGAHLFAARLFCVLASLVTIWLFYRLCRFYFSVTVSGVTTLMLACSWWFLWGSFVVFPMMIQDMGVLMAFYFFERGLRDGKRIYFWWSGVAVGMTVMTYVWGRTALLLVGAWIIVSFLFTENAAEYRKTRLWGLLVWAGGLLWILGPFIGWLFINQEFFGRIKELSMMSLVAKTHDYFLPVKTFYYTIISPFVTYNIDERFVLAGRPLFDRASSLLMLIGLVTAFFGLRKRSSWILILGLATCIPANALAIQNNTPDPTYINGQRFFCIVPFIYWGVAFGLEWIWALIRQEGQKLKKAAQIILIVVVAGSVLWNVKWLYYDFHKTGHWSRLGFNHILIADVVKSYAKDHDIYLCAEYSGSSVVQFMCGGIDIHPLQDSDRLPLKAKPTRDVVFILRAWNFAQPLKDNILKYCPDAKVSSYKDGGDGNDYLWVLDVPLKDFK